MKREKSLTKVVAIVLLLAMALLSFFVLSKPATTPETYAKTIQSIDDKKATVMTLTAAAAAASTGIASIPGDASTPIANQIMAISEYLFIVVCFLVLEKSLLTVMGYLSFNVLIPAACAFLMLYVIVRKDLLKALAAKFVVFALVLVVIIPFSVRISDMIYDMNRDAVDLVTADVSKDSSQEDSEEEKNMLAGLLDKLGGAVSGAGENAKKVLNSFIDAIALFVISYCLIPVIVVFVVMWFIKFLFGISIPVPNIKKLPLRNKEKEADMEETRL